MASDIRQARIWGRYRARRSSLQRFVIFNVGPLSSDRRPLLSAAAVMIQTANKEADDGCTDHRLSMRKEYRQPWSRGALERLSLNDRAGGMAKLHIFKILFMRISLTSFNGL